MTVNKTSKLKKYRGHKTHGCGSKKKRRGAGHRGGRGLAGTGKRGDAKKPSIWKDKSYFGKHGFVNKNKDKVKIVNIVDLNSFVYGYMNGKYKEYITVDNDVYVIDLGKMGIDKLLGKGSLEFKVKVIVSNITESAKSKVISE